jgi:putative peptidoglycan lipid II flippase
VFASSVRWALERMALLVLPVAAGMMALAATGLRVVTIGETGRSGASLIAAALVTLSIGLFPYGAFLLLARAFYALGDSRTPALAALGTSVVGVAVMLVGAIACDGTARIAVLGVGHTTTYVVGTLWLGTLLTRRIGQSIVPLGVARIAAIATIAGAAAWVVASAIGQGDHTRVTAVVASVAGAAVGGAIVLGAYRVLKVTAGLSARRAIAGTVG